MELLRQGIHANEEGVPLEEDNFDEPIAGVNSSLVLSTIIPAEVQTNAVLVLTQILAACASS